MVNQNPMKQLVKLLENPHTGIANLNNITIDSVSYPDAKKSRIDNYSI